MSLARACPRGHQDTEYRGRHQGHLSIWPSLRRMVSLSVHVGYDFLRRGGVETDPVWTPVQGGCKFALLPQYTRSEPTWGTAQYPSMKAKVMDVLEGCDSDVPGRTGGGHVVAGMLIFFVFSSVLFCDGRGSNSE